MKVIVVGAGKISIEYIKVLYSLGIEPIVIGRGIKNIKIIKSKFKGILAYSGGVEKYFETNKSVEYSIVASDLDNLSLIVKLLVKNNVKNILVEKPLSVSIDSVKDIVKLSRKYDINISVAFNRRAYQSIIRAKEIIKIDGGVKSFHFDFSEAIYRQSKSDLEKYSKNNLKYWGICNSSHVIDTVFYLCGNVKEINCFQYGSDINWHSNGSKFIGNGITLNDIPFSYNSDWTCPGKWSIIINTLNHKIIFSPMERLKVQTKDSFQVKEVILDYDIDNEFKAGFHTQCKHFLNKKAFFNIEELEERIILFKKIFNYD